MSDNNVPTVSPGLPQQGIRTRNYDEDFTDYVRDVLVPFVLGAPEASTLEPDGQGGFREVGSSLMEGGGASGPGSLASVLARHLLPKALRGRLAASGSRTLTTSSTHIPTGTQSATFTGGRVRNIPIEVTRSRTASRSISELGGIAGRHTTPTISPTGSATTRATQAAGQAISGRATPVSNAFARVIPPGVARSYARAIGATGALGAVSSMAVVPRFMEITNDQLQAVEGMEVDEDELDLGHEALLRGDTDTAIEHYIRSGIEPENIEQLAAQTLNQSLSDPDATEAERVKNLLEQRYRTNAVNDFQSDIAAGAYPEDVGTTAPPGAPPTITTADQQNFQTQLDSIQHEVIQQHRLNANVVVNDFTVHQIPRSDELEPIRTSRPGESQTRPFHTQSEPELLTVEQTLGSMFDMDNDSLTNLQLRLFATGFYGNQDYEDIPFGIADVESVNAFRRFLTNAAMHTSHADGTDKQFRTWRQLLSSWVSQAGGLEAALADRMAEEEAQQPTFVVQLSDPAGISQSLNQMAERLIGRRSTSPEEQQRLVATIHNQQREAQLTAQRAQHEGGGGTVEVMQPDVGARAMQQIEQEHPDEVAAQTMRGYFDALDQFIGRPGGV